MALRPEILERIRNNTPGYRPTLNLSNDLGLDEALALAEALKTNTTIQSLNLSYNKLGPEVDIALAEVLKTNTTLQTLNLKHNNFGPEGFVALAEALKINTTLQSLNLQSSKLEGEGALALAEALKTNTTLQTLNLKWNNINPEEALALAEALKTNTTLQTLDLSGNSLGPEGVLALAEALKTNTTLQSLNLESNSFGPEGAEALAEALKTNTTLTTLDLRSNDFGTKGALALAEALKTNATLQTLLLSTNNVGTKGALALVETLKTNKTLQTLDLRFYSLGPEGFVALAEALKINTTLQSLSLDHSDLGPEGALALADSLKTNSTLQTLNLGYNRLGPKGALALAKILKTNTTLQTLNLECNNLGPEDAIALAEILKTNTTLQTLNLNGNKFGSEGMLALTEALKTNYTLLSFETFPPEEIKRYLRRNEAIHNCLKSFHTLNEQGNFNLEDIDRHIRQLLQLAPELRHKDNPLPETHYLAESYRLMTTLSDIIHNCLKPFHTLNEQGEFNLENIEEHIHIEEHIEQLLQFAPELLDEDNPLPETHYLAENYRLLAALSHINGVHPDTAIQYLEAPFNNPQLQKLADKAFTDALHLTSTFDEADRDTQKAHNQWLAYQHRNEPESLIFQTPIDQLRKLAKATQENSEEQEAHLLPYQTLLDIAQKTVQSLEDRKTPEALLLLKCLKQTSYHRLTIDKLFHSPLFLEVLKENYPDNQQFQCLETMLFFEKLNKTYTIPENLNDIPPITAENTTEKYKSALQGITEHTPEPSLEDRLNQTKETICRFIGDAHGYGEEKEDHQDRPGP